MDEFNQIAQSAFEAALPPVYHALFDLIDRPYRCCICGGNRWVIERVLPDGVPVYTCSHGTIAGLIRQVDSVNGRDVWRVEALD